MYRAIEDYAVIGNLKSAALVSRFGSIDWAPAPFIDSPSIFASILDDAQGGFWSISPRGDYTGSQKYISKTNIIVTHLSGEEGQVELTDFIPVEKDKEVLNREESAIFEIYRKVRCVKGEVELSSTFFPRFDYARSTMEFNKKEGGFVVRDHIRSAVLVSDVEHSLEEKGHARGVFTLKKGEEKIFIFRYNTTNIPENYDLNYELEYNYTKTYWERWTENCDLGVCNFTTAWEKQVERSALLLKILFFEPTGAIAAAPTTSLPEEIGGVRNWDYRFTWIRDSAFVLTALLQIGHSREARKYIEWILAICTKETYNSDERTHPERLQIMYGLRGDETLEEELLPHLEGYKQSKPVRIGNAAFKQKQWDIYGSILDTIWRMCELGEDNSLAKNNWETLRSFIDYVSIVWREADEGLWEVRGGKQHFVYSKVMCWVALDRGIRLAEKHSFVGDIERWKKMRNEIKSEVLRRGWNEHKKTFVQSYESDALDTAVLRMSSVGFLDGDDPKMISTIDKIEEELSVGEGIFYRYRTQDGLPGQEGAFLIASFWFVDALFLSGQKEKAHTMFTKALEHANHVGLFAEEIDVTQGSFLGNFPQAYTHIGLINSAFALSEWDSGSIKK